MIGVWLTLTKGYFTLVDRDTYEWAKSYNWCAFNNGKGLIYAVRYKDVEPYKTTRYFLHKEILGISRLEQGDHKDGNTLNNTHQNLRIADCIQNSRNRGMNEHAKYKYKGISWYSYSNKWRAAITVDYTKMHIGYYDTQEEAAKAYDEAARKLHGEFARTNEDLGNFRR